MFRSRRVEKVMGGATVKCLVDPGEGIDRRHLKDYLLETPSRQGLAERLARIEEKLADIHSILHEKKDEKEWYRTDEVADILDKSEFTVREKWCNQGRIEAVKDEETGKWRIPAHEVKRLRNGGNLRPQRK